MFFSFSRKPFFEIPDMYYQQRDNTVSSLRGPSIEPLAVRVCRAFDDKKVLFLSKEMLHTSL